MSITDCLHILYPYLVEIGDIGNNRKKIEKWCSQNGVMDYDLTWVYDRKSCESGSWRLRLSCETDHIIAMLAFS